jgi:hypothetical protein
MTLDDGQEDPVLSRVANLRTYDVSQRHAGQLRRQCHKQLQMDAALNRSSGMTIEAWFTQVLGPAVGAAWCLAYLMEIIRSAGAVYRLLR